MTQPRHFAPGQLQFITASTYRRVPLFLSPKFCGEFVKALEAVRAEFDFRLLGWVLMPERVAQSCARSALLCGFLSGG
jgi:hypothetical protein